MENKVNTINKVGRSDFVMMGPIRLRQPLPAKGIEEVSLYLIASLWTL